MASHENLYTAVTVLYKTVKQINKRLNGEKWM